MKAALDHHFQFIHVHRFAQEIAGPAADGAQGDGLFALAGDDDDFGQPFQGEQIGQRGQALLGVARMGRQAQIQQDDQGALGLKDLKRAGPVLGQENLVVVGQRPFHLGAYFFVVINDE